MKILNGFVGKQLLCQFDVSRYSGGDFKFWRFLWNAGTTQSSGRQNTGVAC